MKHLKNFYLEAEARILLLLDCLIYDDNYFAWCVAASARGALNLRILVYLVIFGSG